MLWKVFSVYNEILYHLRYYHGGDDATQLYVLKEEHCGFCWIFYSYFKIILDPLPPVGFELLKKACVAKPTRANRATWEAAISLQGTVGSGFVLQPLGYRANTPSLKTLHSNHRITSHGTEMLFHTEKKIKKKISEPLSTKAKLWIAYSSLLCSLSVCESNCARTCVCVYVTLLVALSLHTAFLNLALWRDSAL